MKRPLTEQTFALLEIMKPIQLAGIENMFSRATRTLRVILIVSQPIWH